MDQNQKIRISQVGTTKAIRPGVIANGREVDWLVTREPLAQIQIRAGPKLCRLSFLGVARRLGNQLRPLFDCLVPSGYSPRRIPFLFCFCSHTFYALPSLFTNPSAYSALHSACTI
jgi:hypothetical protein